MVYNKDYNKDAEEDSQTSRINAAGLINSTLEKLWVESYAEMRNGRYDLWNVKLDSIWCILGGDEEEGGEVDKEMMKINLKIYEKGSLKSKVGIGFEQKDNVNNPVQYQLLLKKSVFLRRLQNKQGKGTAYKTSDMDDFD
ncbi:MAG TPA: hypothetical protein VMZ91_12960 [Candidatus Paceibacterota bacterium]|nr:hypothetical protein [Candidatus Paceibacterota bacterium]